MGRKQVKSVAARDTSTYTKNITQYLLIPCHADMIELTYLTRIMKICHISASASSYALMPTVCLFLKTVIL